MPEEPTLDPNTGGGRTRRKWSDTGSAVDTARRAIRVHYSYSQGPSSSNHGYCVGGFPICLTT